MFIQWGSRWRSSYWLVTFVVALGIATDLLVYSIVIPVLPFHLTELGYDGVSALVGWLLFGYSAGLVIATVPTAMFSEKYKSRKVPLIVGLAALIGSQVMLMEAPVYWLMVIARVLQGISSAMVWVVGLALLCDCTPTNIIGRQLGIAMSGLSIGIIVGPPLGGVLYDRFGFRGPMIFGIAAAFLDLIGRLLIIEPQDLERLKERNELAAVTQPEAPATVPASDSILVSNGNDTNRTDDIVMDMTPMPAMTDTPELVEEARKEVSTLTFSQVLLKLSTSPRALSAVAISLSMGLIIAMIEPAIPLHLANVWGLSPSKIGIVLIAGFAPSLLASPISGYLCDKFGPEWIMLIGLILSIPWWLLLIIRRELGMFIGFFVIANFCISTVISPVTAELASVSRHIEGIGFAHVYGAFNVAYGLGSALGPLIGGQIYDHIENLGWTIICAIIAGILLSCIVVLFIWSGDVSLWAQLRKKKISPASADQAQAAQ
ncbi:hypothetical protein ONZ45_g17237 [Pleurotus djamor]|nr:hypothetical protein ONZ45_g17237 [Pleurotus djamor]